ncbi:MAG: hypothetical protein OH354_01240 [Candidatus Parvarchaeota archaeon]|nr:hypothetical protein [Candidatus Jingweiarchaeum tengchongense]MCW1304386.1 hypothetical protein [Candidatus Jingweiarchaeum tengchongense]MCW1309930.1 hypothetical protein [Candidatus Jingweiarchaeum tengchongense]
MKIFFKKKDENEIVVETENASDESEGKVILQIKSDDKIKTFVLTINEARELRDRISNFLEKNDQKIIELLNQYSTYTSEIPSSAFSMFDTETKVEKKQEPKIQFYY